MNIIMQSRRIYEDQAVIVRANIVGATVRPTYARSSQQWRPEQIAVRWERERINGGEWSEWHVRNGHAAGPKVKRDGSDGAATYTERMYGMVRSGEWAEWVESTRPAAGPGVAELPDPYLGPAEVVE